MPDDGDFPLDPRSSRPAHRAARVADRVVADAREAEAEQARPWGAAIDRPTPPAPRSNYRYTVGAARILVRDAIIAVSIGGPIGLGIYAYRDILTTRTAEESRGVIAVAEAKAREREAFSEALRVPGADPRAVACGWIVTEELDAIGRVGEGSLALCGGALTGALE